MRRAARVRASFAAATLRVFVLGAVLLGAACGGIVNSPYPAGEVESNTLFTSFQERPKYLDPVSSYNNNETPWMLAIYEPLLRYHYLKRPYELEGNTAVGLPEVRYLAADGAVLPDDAPAEAVATSVYTVRLKPGVRYQPHPALARASDGRFLYHDETPEQLRDKSAPADFPLAAAATATREVTAADYVYQIKRIASPYVPTPSPLYGLLGQHIVDLKELGERLRSEHGRAIAARDPRDLYLPWRDLRDVPFAGARALDERTLEIRVKGKYLQFKFWLALPFFAPIPWEADRFYAQRGMAERALSFNQWPIGSGPFMLVEQGANRYVMQRNPNHLGATYPCAGAPGDREAGLLADCGRPIPFVDRIVSSIEKERQPLEAKLIQGYYDVPQIERLDDGFKLQQELADRTGRWRLLTEHGLQLIASVDPNNWYMGFNWLDPVVGKGATPQEELRHRKLRQAISIATDWEEYAEVFFDIYGPAQTAMSPVPPGVFGYRDGCDGVNPVTHLCKDGRPQRRPLAEAKRLLAEAGYPDGRDAVTGKPLVLYYDSNGVGPAYQARLDWQQKQMAKLDIQLEIRATDYNRFQDRMRKGQEQIYFWGWNADYPDAENFLFLLTSAQSKVKYDGENAANYENPEYDRLYDQMRNLPDGPPRQALIDRMADLVRSDAVWMFGFFPGATGVYQSWVHNAKPSIILKDQVKYLRIDVAQRAAKIAEWNRPRPWPLLLFVLGGGLLVWPAWRLWQRREQANARGSVRDAR